MTIKLNTRFSQDLYPLVVLVHLSQNQQQNEEEKAETDHGRGVMCGSRRLLSTQTTWGKEYKNSQIKAQYDILYGQQSSMLPYVFNKDKRERGENLLIR